MEGMDGPYKRTRSATGNIKSSQNFINSETKTPKRNKTESKGKRATNRTPSGQALSVPVSDIRDFFQQKGQGSASPRFLLMQNQSTVKASQVHTPLALNQAAVSSSQTLTYSQSNEMVNQNMSNTQAASKDNGEKALITKTTRAYSDPNIYQSTRIEGVKCFDLEDRIDAVTCERTRERMKEDWNIIPTGVKEDNNLAHFGIECIIARQNKKAQDTNKCDNKANDDNETIDSVTNQHLGENFKQPSKDKSQNPNEQATKPVDPPDSMEANPQVIDLRTVVLMFDQIKKEFADLKGHNIARIEKMEILQTKTQKQVSLLEDKLDTQELKNGILTGIVDNMSQNMRHMEERIENLEIRSFERSIIIKGFVGSTKKNELIDQLYKFFENKVGIDVGIEDAFVIGKGKSLATVVTFELIRDKRLVFKNIDVISKLRNVENKKYFIKDYLPQSANEKRRRDREIMKLLEKSDKMDKLQMSKSGLLVNNKKYEPKVVTLDETTLLRTTPQDLNQLMSINMTKGGRVEQQRSIFIGYSTSVTTHTDVQQAYQRIKLTHADARHVISAYNIPEVLQHEANGFCNDKNMELVEFY